MENGDKNEKRNSIGTKIVFWKTEQNKKENANYLQNESITFDIIVAVVTTDTNALLCSVCVSDASAQ